MRSVKEIREYKTHVETNLYNLVRTNQKDDLTYINDTFEVKEVKAPHYIYRSGLGVRIVDAPAEQIVTSNPQVFVDVFKGVKDSGGRLSKAVNEQWIDILRRQNPNPFKEGIKNTLGRGEFFIKVIHNASWVKGGNRKGLPVIFQILDPMVVYASPEEDENGIPERVVVLYERQVLDVIVRYPFWTDPKKKMADNKTVEWFEYWDKDTKYIEADQEPILRNEKGEFENGGVQPNPYGVTNFVRKYSGFGRRSPDGELANLIVSDIRRSRDLLREECAMRSNIASVEYLFAHKSVTITAPEAGLDEEKMKDISFGAYDANVWPAGTRVEFLDIKPSPESYKHHADIIAELNQRHPFVLAGFPFGTSGRQQDMTQTSAMRRYDSVVENAENAWATAFEIALKICEKVPGLRPDYFRKADLKSDYQIQVKLKAKDPIEADRKITMGNTLWAGGQGSIPLREFHVEYLGKTVHESDVLVAQMLADQITLNNPEIAALLGSVAAREGGLEQALEQLRQAGAQDGGGLREPPTPAQRRRIQGEVRSPEGLEESAPRGARRPPRRV